MTSEESLDEPRESTGGSDRMFITALGRGLQILECCGSAGVDLTVSEVAKRLDMPQATVWRACHTLLRCGFLVRTSGDRLRPGLALLRLGHAALARQPLGELARPEMEALARKFPGAVSLGVRENFEMLYIQRVDGGPVIYPGLRAGSRVTLIASAMGWAFVAGMPEAEQKRFLAAARQHSPEMFARLQRQLREAIRSFATERLIVNSGVIHPELNAVAVPIGRPGRMPVAAVSFGGLKAKFPLRRLIQDVAPRLQAIADALSMHEA